MARSRPKKRRPASPGKQARREARAAARQETAAAVVIPVTAQCRQVVIPPYARRTIRCELSAGPHPDGMHEAEIDELCRLKEPDGSPRWISPEWEVTETRLRWPQR